MSLFVLRRTTLAVVLSQIIFFLSAQTIDFQKSYGGIRDDAALAVREIPDGNYVLFGSTKSFGYGNTLFADFYLLKTDQFGDSLWARTYGTSAGENGICFDLTKDKGYILGGTYEYNGGLNCYLLMKLKQNGDTSWTKKYFTSRPFSDHTLTSVKQTNDKGFILAGYTNGFDSTNTDIWIIKTDSMGRTLWSKRFGGKYNDEAGAVIQTADGGYAICGTTFSYGINNGSYSDVYLIKTNSLGDSLWARHYGGPDNDLGNDVLQTTDKGYIIAASTYSYGRGMADFWLIKTDSTGDTTWTKTFGNTAMDFGRFVKLYNGGYIIGGITYSYGAGLSDGYLVFTSANGSYLKSMTFGGLNVDEFWNADVTQDNDILLAGTTESMGHGYNDMYFVKLKHAVGIPENQNQNSNLLVYPNPFKNETKFYFKDTKSENISLTLYDIYAREIKTLKLVATNYITLQRDDLKPGLYFYTLKTGDGKVFKGKIIAE